MALKPTIFKVTIHRSDLNNDVYDSINLTIAQHPSENTERMMARILAFTLLPQQEFLTFTKGLSEVDDPDIIAKSLADELLLWVDMGEPAFDRIKKASRAAKSVAIYSFNTKSDVWWIQGQSSFEKLANLSVYQFDFQQIQALTQQVKRSMEISITLSGESCYIASELGECEVVCKVLKEA